MKTGIPTKYRDTTFRSRLEARWFAFFDLMGWDWEYEPFDAKGYIPDGVLLGPDPVLIEIKPDTTVVELRKHSERVLDAVRGQWEHDVLFLGSTPFPTPDDNTGWTDVPSIGLLGEWIDIGTHSCWSLGDGLWTQCSVCGRDTFCHAYQSYRNRVCGHHEGNVYGGRPNIIRKHWDACRDVARWTPTR